MSLHSYSTQKSWRNNDGRGLLFQGQSADGHARQHVGNVYNNQSYFYAVHEQEWGGERNEGPHGIPITSSYGIVPNGTKQLPADVIVQCGHLKPYYRTEITSGLSHVKMRREVRDALKMAGMDCDFWEYQGGIRCWRRGRPGGPEVMCVRHRKHFDLFNLGKRHAFKFEPLQPMSRRGYDKLVGDFEATLRKNLAMSKT